jgi:hypothetical protein
MERHFNTRALTADEISKMRTSVNHQLEVHEAPAFLPVLLNIGSPQSALDVDKDTSCRIRYSSVTEKSIFNLKLTILKGSLPQVYDGVDHSRI